MERHIDVTCINASRTKNITTRDDTTRNKNTAVSSLVYVTCIDGPIVEVALYRIDNTTTCVDNIRNNTNAISIVNVTCIAFDAVPIVGDASYSVSRTDNTSTCDDNTCIDVACNSNTAIDIVSITCIAFNAVPIVEVASYTPP